MSFSDKSREKKTRQERPRRGRRLLRDVVYADLTHADRLEKLYSRAVADGVITRSDLVRVDFYAAACQAAEKGRDAVRLFCHIVNNQNWASITCQSEDAGRAMLRAYENRHLPRPADEAREPQTLAAIIAGMNLGVRAQRSAAS